MNQPRIELIERLIERCDAARCPFDEIQAVTDILKDLLEALLRNEV